MPVDRPHAGSSDVPRTTVSVRAEARRVVAPDQASLWCSIHATGKSKSAATSNLAALVAATTARLEAISARPLGVATARWPLTWSTQAITTQAEHALNPATGMHQPTGRQQTTVTMLIIVRDFGLLDPLAAVLVGQDEIDINSVQWAVDDDNAEWAGVRAEAIQAALLKGQDYASALGGSVVSVEHVADAGLLGGEAAAWRAQEFALNMSGGGPDAPSLDPVPQPIGATIEARFIATVGPLPTR